MILLAVWVGKTKPDMNAFLEPLTVQLAILENQGGLLSSINQAHIRVTVLLFTMDMRAKVFQNIYSSLNLYNVFLGTGAIFLWS